MLIKRKKYSYTFTIATLLRKCQYSIVVAIYVRMHTCALQSSITETDGYNNYIQLHDQNLCDYINSHEHATEIL